MISKANLAVVAALGFAAATIYLVHHSQSADRKVSKSSKALTRATCTASSHAHISHTHQHTPNTAYANGRGKRCRAPEKKGGECEASRRTNSLTSQIRRKGQDETLGLASSFVRTKVTYLPIQSACIQEICSKRALVTHCTHQSTTVHVHTQVSVVYRRIYKS